MALITLLGLPSAHGSSYVPVSDEGLARAAEAVAVVRVLDDGAPSAAGSLPATRYWLQVEETLIGALPTPRIRLTVPGGVNADGMVWRAYGAPRWQRGDRLIAFLTPRRDGTWGLEQFLLGAFREQRRGLLRLAVRDLSQAEAMEVAGPGAPASSADSTRPRGFEGFADWLRDMGRGLTSSADYRVEAPPGPGDGIGRASDAYSYLDADCSGSSYPARWFTFDGGGSVSWRIGQGGQPGMTGSPAGEAEFRNALNLWNDDAGSNVRVTYAGTTTETRPTTTGTGVIAFEDPDDEISGSFEGSGVLAIGGPYYQCGSPRLYAGQPFRTAVRGFVVTQDGAGSYFGSAGGKNGEEVFAHEIGHTLGFGHTSVSGSLMLPNTRGDGRGAFLGSDDRAALSATYAASSDTGGENPGGDEPPQAPEGLQAEAQSVSQILLQWRDLSTDETHFRLDIATGQLGPFRHLGTVASDSTGVRVTRLQADTLYRFRIRACDDSDCSTASNIASARTPAGADGTELPAECREPGVLCLQGGRFAVDVTWRNQHEGGSTGIGHPVGSSEKTGMFWFFNSDNVELVVKVLDGRQSNGHYWVFYGGLSDVEYEVRVRDLVEGGEVVYHNPPGAICGHGDTTAIPASGGAGLVRAAALPDGPRPVPVDGEVAEAAGVGSAICSPADDRLCLAGGRFEVRVRWANQHAGDSGTGRVLSGEPAGDKTGFFWFFNPANVELVVKMIDGRQVNGHFWFFYGALSDVEYEIEVRDTLTDEVRIYENQAGSICGRGDTAAF